VNSIRNVKKYPMTLQACNPKQRFKSYLLQLESNKLETTLHSTLQLNNDNDMTRKHYPLSKHFPNTIL